MSKNKVSQTTSEEIFDILKEVSKSQKELTESQKETDSKIKELSESNKELSESQKETDRQMKETDRKIKELTESQKETDRQMKETDRQMKETDLQIKETGKHLKKVDNFFNSQWGKLMESLVKGDIVKLLKQRNIKVERVLAEHELPDKEDEYYEVDIIAINGEEVVVTEVKTTLKVRDVDHFINKLKDFKNVFKEYKDRKIYGAVAYLKADEYTGRYSEKQGLFVIRATGSSASITNKENFKPTEF